jgi:hypothetical protein
MSIALVQQVTSLTAAGGSASKTITIAAPAPGNALRLCLNYVGGQTITSVSGGGVTWSSVSTIAETGTGNVAAIWQGDNSSGSGTTITIVVQFTYSQVDVNLSEWSGMPATPVGDGGPSTNTGTSATVTSASITPTAGQDVLLIAAAVGSGGSAVTNTPSGGFTALSTSGGSVTGGFGYLIASSASGSYSTTFPLSASYYSWAITIAGWDGTSGGGGGGGTTSFPASLLMAM